MYSLLRALVLASTAVLSIVNDISLKLSPSPSLVVIPYEEVPSALILAEPPARAGLAPVLVPNGLFTGVTELSVYASDSAAVEPLLDALEGLNGLPEVSAFAPAACASGEPVLNAVPEKFGNTSL